MSLQRVFGPTLESNKPWYALNGSICRASPSRFVKQMIFQKVYKNEVQSVQLSTLTIANGSSVPREAFGLTKQPCVSEAYVATPFGLYVGLLRQNDPQILSQFSGIDDLVNRNMNLENIGAKFEGGDEVQKVNTASLEDELQKNHAIILNLEINLKRAEEKMKYLQEQLASVDELLEATEPPKKKQRVGNAYEEKHRKVFHTFKYVAAKHQTSIASVLGHMVLISDSESTDLLSEITDKIVATKGAKKAVEELLSDDSLQEYFKLLRVPDWALLYFKLSSMIPDDAWQTMLNITHLGRSGKQSDFPLLLTKGQVKAVRRLIFTIVKDTLGIDELPLEYDIPGAYVNLRPVMEWMVREMHLHRVADDNSIEVNLKLDGRPFWGRDQVMIGLVPIGVPIYKEQSAKTVFPIVIANCSENRQNLVTLMRNLNKQKNDLKRNGMMIDGKHVSFTFTVTMDYKAIQLLARKKDDEDFKLGGKGLDKELCLYCTAIRKCRCPNVDPGDTCVKCFAESKGDIGKWKGIRDDLEFLLDVEISDICLCSLHCEMRNTEQIIGSLGLYAYNCGALDLLNKKLSELGPPNFKKDYVKVKERKNQQTKITKSNIKVNSFSGPTERRFLRNIEEIIDSALPENKVIKMFPDRDATEMALLKMLRFCEEMITDYKNILSSKNFTRDHGLHQEEIAISPQVAVGKFISTRKDFWQSFKSEIEEKLTICDGKDEKLADLIKYGVNMKKKMITLIGTQWRDIALIMRDEIFEKDEHDKIDNFDVQCKEWGYVLRHLFGNQLGTGDYGHLTIEHASMLMRRFGSMCKYSGQGFESSHKLHRQLYAKATNHDQKKPGDSAQHILQHHYATYMLFLRYSFRKAQECYSQSKAFLFPGCGWRSKKVGWTVNDYDWICKINNTFDEIFGDDFLKYSQTETKTCIVDYSSIPEKYQNVFFPMKSESSMPKETHATPEIPETSKQPTKPNNKTNKEVKRELTFITPRTQPLRLPKVCPWGGLYKSSCGTIEINLTNTCPIDNFLTMFSLNIKENSFLWNEIQQVGKPYAAKLLEVVRLYGKEHFPEAKIRWLEQMPTKFNVLTSGTINVWGNEHELFVQCLSEAFTTIITSTCSSVHCPRNACTTTNKTIHLQEISIVRPNENYLQASLREWLHPSPTQCGERFKSSPPSDADWVFGPPEICLITNQVKPVPVCNGVRTYSTRQFANGMPFALPISLQLFSTQGLITEVNHLPPSITIEKTEYKLVGSTLFGNHHYNACLKLADTWGHYDGLRESSRPRTGILMGSIFLERQAGYSLSTCLYLKKE